MKFKVLTDIHGRTGLLLAQKGETVYKLQQYDYGMAREDSDIL